MSARPAKTGPREDAFLQRLRGRLDKLLHGAEEMLPYACLRPDGQMEWPPPAKDRRALSPCVLALPPGMTALTHVVLPEDNVKAAFEQLEAAAAASLLEDPEKGFVERRAVRLGEQTRAVQGWIAASTLEQVLTRVEEQGFEARYALVPEFCLASAEPTLLVRVESQIAYCYYIEQRAPLLNQTASAGGPSLKLCLQLLAAEIEEQDLAAPARALLWAEAEFEDARRDTQQSFPGLEIMTARTWSEALAWMQTPRKGGVFSQLLASHDRQPLSKERLVRLALATFAMLAGVVALLFALLSVYERETEQLEREVRELKVLAHRSSGAKQRIQELSKKLTLIRRAAKEKPNLLMDFQAIDRVKPHLVKLNDISITRQGALRITGQAKNKEYVAKFQREMSAEVLFLNPRLESLEADAATGEARFLLHATLPYWTEFFRIWDEGLKEEQQAPQRGPR